MVETRIFFFLILVGRPEEKRAFSRLRSRRADNIKMDLQTE
jgi:hypothetical protein